MMKRFLSFLRRDLWSPYVAGVMLGLVVILSMWGADHTVGASGAFQNLAAYLGLALSSTETTIEPAAAPATAAQDTSAAQDDAAALGGADEAASGSADDAADFWADAPAAAEDDAAAFWGADEPAAEEDDTGFWTDAPASAPAPADTAAAATTQTVAKEGLEGQYTFFAFISPKGISWMVWLMVGIFFGALISAVLSGGFRLSLLPHSEQWQRIFGRSVIKRWALVFAGSVIIAVAAGIAGGCTSGLAIAKGVQLAPAAFLFIIGMFVTGPITAGVIYRRRY